MEQPSADSLFLDETGAIIDYLERYQENLADLIKFCNSLLRKMKALTPEATPRDKITAVSIPGMEIISKKIHETTENCKSIVHSMKEELEKMQTMIESGGIICTNCEGIGEIRKQECYRDEGVQFFTRVYRCPVCNGKGLLPFSTESLVHHAKKAIENLKKIVNESLPSV
jgi:hypothetical protein